MERLGWLFEGLMTGVPAVVVAAGIVVYGGVLVWLLGTRTPQLIVVESLPVAIGALALTSAAMGSVGLSAPLPMTALGTLLVAAGFGLVRRRIGGPTADRERDPETWEATVWLGAAVGAAVGVAAWVGGIGDFGIPPQANDDIWHGYLVERLTHMNEITPWTVAPTLTESSTPVAYYPYGAHLVAALAHQLTGVTVPELLNGAWLVWIAALFPAGIAVAARSIFRQGPWVSLAAGALAGGVTLFPYLTNGVFSYSVALAMVPGFLAALHRAMLGLDSPRAVIVLAALGLFITHPAGALVAAVIGGLMLAEHVVRVGVSRLARDAALRVGLVGVIAGTAGIPWVVAVGSVGVGAPATNAAVNTPATAATMAASLASPWTPGQPLLAALVLVGAAATVSRREGIGWTVGWALFGVLYAGVLAGSEFITSLTGPWYGNWYRLAGVLGLMAPLLAGLGLVSAVRWVAHLPPRVVPRTRPVRWIGAGVLVLAVGAAVAYDAARGQSIVRTAWHAPMLVTADDIRVLGELSARLTDGDRVLNSPRDGSTWMYPLYEARPLQPYVYPQPVWLAELLAGTGAYADPAAQCSGLAEIGATYALVKEVRGDEGTLAYDVAGFVRRWANLFILVVDGASTTAYRIDRDALADCVGH